MASPSVVTAIVKNVTFTEKTSGQPPADANDVSLKWLWPPTRADSFTNLPTLKSLTIISYEFRTAPDKQATFYTIECENSLDEKYTICRRFARLKLLYEWITSEVPQVKVPPLPKKIFTFWKGKAEEANARKAALQAILNYLVTDPTLKYCGAILSFFANNPNDLPTQRDKMSSGLLYVNVCETRGWKTTAPIKEIRCFPCLEYLPYTQVPMFSISGSIDRRGEFSFFQEVSQYCSWKENSALALCCRCGTNSNEVYLTSLPLSVLKPYQLYDVWLPIHGFTKTGTQRAIRCLVQFTPSPPVPVSGISLRLPQFRLQIFQDAVLLGDTLRGYVIVNLSQPTNAKGILVTLNCSMLANSTTSVHKQATYTEYGYYSRMQFNRKEIIHTGFRYIELDSNAATLPPGCHVFPFEMWIPPDAEPSSMNFMRDSLLQTQGAIFWSLSAKLDMANDKFMRFPGVAVPIRVVDKPKYSSQLYMDRIINNLQRNLCKEVENGSKYIERIDATSGLKAELIRLSSFLWRLGEHHTARIKVSSCDGLHVRLVAVRRKFSTSAPMRERLREYTYSKRKPPSFDDQNEQLRLTLRKQARDAQKKDDAPYYTLLVQDDETIEEDIVETLDASLQTEESKKSSAKVLVAKFDLKSFGTTSSPRRPRISPDEEISAYIEVLSASPEADKSMGLLAFPVFVVPRHWDSPSECSWLYPLQSHSTLRSEHVSLFGQCLPHWPVDFHRSQTRCNFPSAKDEEDDALLCPNSIFSPPGHRLAHFSPVSLRHLVSVPVLEEEFPNVHFDEERFHPSSIDIAILLEYMNPTLKLGAFFRDQTAEEDAEMRTLAKMSPQASSSSSSSQSASTSSSSYSSPPVI